MSVTVAFLKALAEDVNKSFLPTIEQLLDRLPVFKTTKKAEELRAWIICDWLARGVVFAWLERAGFVEELERLRSMRAVNRETATDAFAMLTIFDTEITMPVVMAGKVNGIDAEAQAVVETEQHCGVYAAMDFHINNAVEGLEYAKLYATISSTAARIISACIQKCSRDVSIEGVARTLGTVARVERSIEPLVIRLATIP